MHENDCAELAESQLADVPCTASTTGFCDCPRHARAAPAAQEPRAAATPGQAALVDEAVREWLDRRTGTARAAAGSEAVCQGIDRLRHLHLDDYSYTLTPAVLDALAAQEPHAAPAFDRDAAIAAIEEHLAASTPREPDTAEQLERPAPRLAAAPGPHAADGKTGGQVACDAFWETVRGDLARTGDAWDWALGQGVTKGWEAAAQAVEAGIRGRMLALAARLYESAAATEPSRKSEIEREIAIHIRQELDV